MKAVIQRVLSASVAVDDKAISSIGQGLLVLIGIDKTDEPSDSSFIIKKLLAMKLFDGEDGTLWKRNVQEIGGEVLCVSQFTLYAAFKGTKPEFRDAMSPSDSRTMFANFLDEIKAAYSSEKVKENQFGVTGTVSLINDGPTTILLDSKERKPKSSSSGTSTPSSITMSTNVDDSEEAKFKQAAKAAKKAQWEAKQALKAEKFGQGQGQGQTQSKKSSKTNRQDVNGQFKTNESSTSVNGKGDEMGIDQVNEQTDELRI